jgi:hypothetical protein
MELTVATTPEASQEALAGFLIHCSLASTDRAVKAAPTGGLRPALTALPVPSRPEDPSDKRFAPHLTSRSISVPRQPTLAL